MNRAGSPPCCEVIAVTLGNIVGNRAGSPPCCEDCGDCSTRLQCGFSIDKVWRLADFKALLQIYPLLVLIISSIR